MLLTASTPNERLVCFAHPFNFSAGLPVRFAFVRNFLSSRNAIQDFFVPDHDEPFSWESIGHGDESECSAYLLGLRQVSIPFYNFLQASLLETLENCKVFFCGNV